MLTTLQDAEQAKMLEIKPGLAALVGSIENDPDVRPVVIEDGRGVEAETDAATRLLGLIEEAHAKFPPLLWLGPIYGRSASKSKCSAGTWKRRSSSCSNQQPILIDVNRRRQGFSASKKLSPIEEDQASYRTS